MIVAKIQKNKRGFMVKENITYIKNCQFAFVHYGQFIVFLQKKSYTEKSMKDISLEIAYNQDK